MPGRRWEAVLPVRWAPAGARCDSGAGSGIAFARGLGRAGAGSSWGGVISSPLLCTAQDLHRAAGSLLSAKSAHRLC